MRALTRSLVERSPTSSLAYAAAALALALNRSGSYLARPLSPLPSRWLQLGIGVSQVVLCALQRWLHVPVAADEREAVALDLRQLLLVPEAQLQQPPLQPAQVVLLRTQAAADTSVSGDQVSSEVS